MLKLKEQYTTQDMQTILDRQITILGIKKKSQTLPEKVEDEKKKATITPSYPTHKKSPIHGSVQKKIPPTKL